MHKSKLLCATLVLALLAGSASTLPFTQDDELTPLQEAMSGLQSGQRKLRKLIKDPADKDAALEVVHGMQRGALTAFGLPPSAPEGMEAAKQAGWRIGFQRQVLKVVDTLLVLELAVVEGDVEAAKAAYSELNAVKKAGHDAFQVD